MEWRIPLTDIDVGQEEIDAVAEVLRGKWLTMGAVTEEFEKQFASKMNVGHAIAVNNGTAALHLANLALGIGPGDEVICPNITFVASANASRYCGADLVFADVISQDDLTIAPASIEAMITPRTRAITVVHYGGFVCRMDEVMDIARMHGLKVIEDCAHAPFASHGFADGVEAFAGTMGDVGCFSFFGNKNMTTGEGGMVTTNDDDLAARIRLLRSHGMTSLTYERHKGHASGYDVVTLGYNYRTDEMHSAMGICQLRKIDQLNSKRRQIYRWYIAAFADSHNVRIPFTHRDLDRSACHILPAIVTSDYTGVKQRLKNAGIQTSKHYDPVSGFSIYTDSRRADKMFDGSSILTLPLGPQMELSDVELIREVCG